MRDSNPRPFGPAPETGALDHSAKLPFLFTDTKVSIINTHKHQINVIASKSSSSSSNDFLLSPIRILGVGASKRPHSLSYPLVLLLTEFFTALDTCPKVSVYSTAFLVSPPPALFI